ncbi:hypothetical protein FQA39_LY10825 [Lamprigera yunnana]|nr:hypothetical protein FQA39_LY10825 [Lamprigera yunnana]
MKKWYESSLGAEKSDWVCAEIHSARCKEHLLKKLESDWYSFNDGKEVYISHKKTIGAALADTARTQVTEDEADKIVDVAVLLRKYILFQQMPFNGSFSSGCLSEPVAKLPLILMMTRPT